MSFEENLLIKVVLSTSLAHNQSTCPRLLYVSHISLTSQATRRLGFCCCIYANWFQWLFPGFFVECVMNIWAFPVGRQVVDGTWHMIEGKGLNFLTSAKQFWSLKILRAHKSKIHWRNEHEKFIIQMKKKIKQENLGLLLGSKCVPLRGRWSCKTPICVSNFVLDKSCLYQAGLSLVMKLLTPRLTVSGSLSQRFFLSTWLQPSKGSCFDTA